ARSHARTSSRNAASVALGVRSIGWRIYRALPRGRGRTARGAAATRSAPVVERDVRSLGRTDVDLARPADLRSGVFHHLFPVRDPSGQAADREQDREHLRREAHGPVDQTRVEVDVRIQLALDEVVVVERDILEL